MAAVSYTHLEEISKGEMYIGGRLINDVPPQDRDIAMVFQSYALYPHMTVYKNIAFGLELRKTPKDEICLLYTSLPLWARLHIPE